MIWRRWPANQVLIDGRYDGILFDEALLEAYLEAQRSPTVLDRITAAYDVEILVLSAHPNWTIPYIGEHPGWARVYWDMVAEVYVRRGGPYTDLIATHEYRLTRSEPDLSYLIAYRRDSETWARSLLELRGAVADNPENTRAWLGLAQEYRAAGPAAVGQRVDALARAAALLIDEPVLGRVHGERAEALLELGQFDEAVTAAQKALHLDAELILPRAVLAEVAGRRGAWGEARDQLRAILRVLDRTGDPRASTVRAWLETVEKKLHEDGGG